MNPGHGGRLGPRPGLLALVLLAGTAVSGCAGVYQSREDDAWLVDGRTTRAEALQRLGEPAQYYQGGYILAYRYTLTDSFQTVNGDSRGGRLSVGASYANLILVFGADKVLLRHSRVALK